MGPVIFMRRILFCAFLSGSALLSTGLRASDDEVYQLTPGEAPPVAPSLIPGSPLDHLANDPKRDALPVGYKEGETKGDAPWIAHRMIAEDIGKGWGWIKKSGDNWDSAQWFALQETPGLAVAPHRKLAGTGADLDWEFKFWGGFASNKAYDPDTDREVPIFVLRGYEAIGPAAPLHLRPGPPDRPRSLSDIGRVHGWGPPTFELLVTKVFLLLIALGLASGAALDIPVQSCAPGEKPGRFSDSRADGHAEGGPAEHPILIIKEIVKGRPPIRESSIFIPDYMAQGNDPKPHSGAAIWELGSMAEPICGGVFRDTFRSLRTALQGYSAEASRNVPGIWEPAEVRPAESTPYYLAFFTDHAKQS
jgi:hypothetical protein